MIINETVLEMHYHRSLIELFQDTFGLGEGGTLNFYKYSPQKEVFVGFDQAFVRAQLTPDQLFELLSDRAMNHNYQFEDQFLGYFLQFKVVKIMRKRTKYRFFNDVTDEPVWCSEPTRGEAVSPHEFAAKINDHLLTLSARDSNAALHTILTNLEALGIEGPSDAVHRGFPRDVLDLTYESLNIIRIRRPV